MKRPSNRNPIVWIFELVLDWVGTFLRRFLPDKIVSVFIAVSGVIFFVFFIYVVNYTKMQRFFGY